MDISCKHCLKNKAFKDNMAFFKHLKTYHIYARQFFCGIVSCSRKFSNIYALKKHMQIYSHTSRYTENFEKGSQSLQNSTDTSVGLDIISQEENSQEENTDINLENSNNCSAPIQNSVAKFIAKFYDNPSVTRKVVQSIVEDTSELVSDILDLTKCRLETYSNQLDKNLLADLLSEIPLNPLHDFSTEFKRFKYFENSKCFVKPTPFLIGHMLDDDRSKTRHVSLNYKKCEGQIVSMRRVLQVFLQTNNVLQTIKCYINEESVNKENITSIFNAKLWQTVKAKFDGKFVLPLIVYFDDYEPDNPLGSQAGLHKIGALYFSIAGIPPQFASQLENIFLWGLFYSSDRSLHGTEKVVQNFVDELKFLEKRGITLDKDHGNERIFFALMFVVGDNLGVNSMLGFSECFSSGNFCRFCRCNKEVSQIMLEEDVNLLRNESNYASDLLNKTGGIKQQCIWNELLSYNNITNYSFDIMHDIYEGICRYDLAEILNCLIYSRKYFTLEQLNARIKYFDYRDIYDVGNRIPTISKHHIDKRSLVISSAEMSSLVTYLGLLVGDLIDEDDDCWHFFLILFEIIHIITKPITDEREPNYLTDLIKQHHEMFLSLFNKPLKPKHHHLLHYPRCIRISGPLCHLSSIRYEAFHKIAKTNVHIVTTRRNIVYTLAIRHQLKLSYRLLNAKGFEKNFEFGEPAFIFTVADRDESILAICGKFSNEDMVVPWIKIYNYKYQPKIYIQIDRRKNGEPSFGVIHYMVVTFDKSDIYFIFTRVVLLGINSHIQAYIIEYDEQNVNVSYEVINYKDLFSKIPSVSHRLNSTKGQAISILRQDQ